MQIRLSFVDQRISPFAILLITAIMFPMAPSKAFSQCPTCPSEVPLPEIARGWNLYWHNPCHCQNENCYPSTCATALSPIVYGVADFTPLYRDESGSVSYPVNGGASTISTGDFKPDFDAGGRFLMGVAIGDYYRLEGAYSGAYDWEDRHAVLVGGSTTEIDFSSNMASAEINLRRRIQLLSDVNFNRFSLFNQGEPLLFHRRAESSILVGARYMKIDERFGYTGGGNDYNVRADNEMFGAQLGWLSQFLILPRTWIDFEIKGALFHNAIDVNLTGSATDSDARDRTSFLGDLSLMYNHQVTRAITFRAGYTAMWVTDIALATQNFDSNVITGTAVPLEVNNDGNTVYHGPSLGLVLAF